MNSNIASEKWPSWGEVRKNHLKPRSVRSAATDSGVTKGMPCFSAIALAVTVMPD